VREHTLLAALVVLGLACPTVIRAENQSVEEQIVDAMNKRSYSPWRQICS